MLHALKRRLARLEPPPSPVPLVSAMEELMKRLDGIATRLPKEQARPPDPTEIDPVKQYLESIRRR